MGQLRDRMEGDLPRCSPSAAAASTRRPTRDDMTRLLPADSSCRAWLCRAASPRCAHPPHCALDFARAGPARRAHTPPRVGRWHARLTRSPLHAPSAAPISA